MNKKEQIQKKIEELKVSLDNIKGTTSEVYTRIVGYYRPIQNWNKGKSSEYYQRKEFASKYEDKVDVTHLQTPISNTLDITVADKQGIKEYKLFYSDSCPNCPPVKNFMSQTQLTGNDVNASTKNGFDEAVKYNIKSTPTVVFFDKQGDVLEKAHNVSQIKCLLG